MVRLRFTALLLCLILSGSQISLSQRTFTLDNQCSFTVWPGTLSNAGMATLFQGGTTLGPGATFQYTAPAGWAGRLWGRAGCLFDTSGTGVCSTGDCGKGLYCDGAGGIPPATLAEFTLDGYGAQDFYDVSLVDGYNLPLQITATGGTASSGACGAPGCVTDLNESCPSELQEIVNGEVAACKSACEAFGSDNYCCAGAYNSPQTCVPTTYSTIFKAACPTAYSYAYDDQSSTFTCTDPTSYTITFCPSGIRMGSPTPGSMPSPPLPAALAAPPPPSNTSTTVPPPPPTGITSPPPPGSLTTPPPTPGNLTFPPPRSIVGTTPPIAGLSPLPPPPSIVEITPPPPPIAGFSPPPPPSTGLTSPPPPMAGLSPPPPTPTSEVSPTEGPMEDYSDGSFSAAGSSFPFWWEHLFFSMVALTTTTLFMRQQ